MQSLNVKSSAVNQLNVDELERIAQVEFKNGLTYLYENVSKRSIINLLFNPDVSLGFWVNNNCRNSDRTETLSYDKGRLEKAYKGAKLPEFA